MCSDIVKVIDYKILKLDAADRKEALEANAGALTLTEFDMDRARIPSGGSLQFQLDDDKTTSELIGVITAFKDIRVYWQEPFGESQTGPPDCVSEDCVHGNPGGLCSQCPFAQFGSDGRGQACSQRRVLFLTRSDKILPLALSLPPMSLKNAKRYFRIKLGEEGLPYYRVVTRLGLEEDKNATGIKFAKVTFEKLLVLESPVREQFKAIHELMQKQMGQTPAVAAVQEEPVEA
jgi:hypothetical protein